MVIQNDLEWVLEMAKGELRHLAQDATDADRMKDYLHSKGALKRVREQLTAEGRIKP